MIPDVPNVDPSTAPVDAGNWLADTFMYLMGLPWLVNTIVVAILCWCLWYCWNRYPAFKYILLGMCAMVVVLLTMGVLAP